MKDGLKKRRKEEKNERRVVGYRNGWKEEKEGRK